MATSASAPPAVRNGPPLAPIDGPKQSLLDFGGSPSRMQTANTARRQMSAQLLSSTGRSTTAALGNMSMREGTLMQTSNLSEQDNIKVAVRVRPLFPHENEKGAQPVIQVHEDHTTVQIVVPGPAGNKMQRDFQFHACLGPDVNQGDVLQLCGVPQLLDAALSGYNVTIFAYGQTGSGKTYTMSGREEVISNDGYNGDTHDGIMTRAVQYLWKQIKERQDAKYALSASYLEIYNEGIYDLLNLRAKNLHIKWDAAQGFFVPGLKAVDCKDYNAMMEVIRLGMKHRHVGSHELNIESSRSHALMTIHCAATPTDPGSVDCGIPRFGKICFVDLAGSERLKDSKSEGTMLKETTNINKSLFVLGKVISALADRDSNGTSAHIPYRDSKLTKLLMDSLGGSALALMIACCSPSSQHVEETLSTLSYATRAKNIQNRPTIQYDPKEQQISALRREIDLLRQENTYLREQLRLGGTASIPATPSGTTNAMGRADSLPSPTSTSHLNSEPPGPGGLSVTFPEWPSLASYQNPSTPSGHHHHSHHRPPSGPGSPSLHASRMMSPRVGGSNGHMALGDSLRSSVASMSLEPLRLGVDAQWSWDNGAASTAIRSARESTGFGQENNMLKRLKDTQALLARFSEENSRLAKENDKLKVNKQLLNLEHGDLLDEIDVLRSRLTGLESAVITGSQSPTAIKAMLSTIRSGAGAAAQRAATAMSTTSHHPRTGSVESMRGMPYATSGEYSAAALAPDAGGYDSGSIGGDYPSSSFDVTSARPESTSGMSDGDRAPDLSTYAGQYKDLLRKSTADLSSHLNPGSKPDSAQHNNHTAMYSPAIAPQPPAPTTSQYQDSQKGVHMGNGGSQSHRPASGAQGAVQGAPGSHHSVANVLVVSGSPGASMRSRQGSAGPVYGKQDGRGGSKADGSNDSIIIADKAKLALLLGN